MSRIAKPAKTGEPPAFLCRNRDEVTAALVAIRQYLGISQQQLDMIAGFNDGYTAKLEQPDTPGNPEMRKTGRRAINPMFDLWIGALPADIVIFPRGGDPDVRQPTKPPARSPKISTKKADKIRRLYATGRHTRFELCGKFGYSLRTIAEILENRAHVAAKAAA